MWDFIINPFVTILTFLYSILGNDIILAISVFTVIVRLATSPLVSQQTKSSTVMQEMKPELDELKKRLKDDKNKLAAAQMELYRRKGVNPAAGCLPLLIQLPIIFGLYGAISIALGSTPFQVIDLSGRLLLPNLDTYVPLNHVWLGVSIIESPSVLMSIAPWVIALPILVMVTTWLQSKLAMPPMTEEDKRDPTIAATRSMTTVMPLMFGFFALSFSVGLSIYFIVSNVVGIIQYTVMGKAYWRSLFGMPEKDGRIRGRNLTPEGEKLVKDVIEVAERQASGAGQSAALSARPQTRLSAAAELRQQQLAERRQAAAARAGKKKKK